MTEKTNRRDLIVETAGQLFIEQGYEATSVRQIAEASGVTEAALYYHFKDGKRGLLQAVVECQMPDLFSVLELCHNASSLQDLIHKFITQMGKIGPSKIGKMRWMISEFPNLSDAERAMFHYKHSAMRTRFTELIQQFVPDPQLADHITVTVICATFGYGQLFWSLDLKSISDFRGDDLAEILSEAIAARYS
jgi:AcrR family transcriptional regulator